MRVDWVLLDEAGLRTVRVGDLVSTEAGGMPTYRVVTLKDGRAWLRDVQSGADRISPLGCFHWKASAGVP